MAVDANVIIFARIREEISAGSNVKRAIRVGFDKALSAIIDGNVTTLIAAAVLFFLGSGTIKGFAETLAIGIILSMFTALFVTRTLMNIFYALGAKNPALYGKGRAANNFKIVGKRKIVFLISALCILIGFGAMGLNASRHKGLLNYSLDFVGGTSTNVEFTEEMSLEEINDKVVPVFEDVIKDANVQVQKVTGTNEVIFKTKELDTDQSTELSNRLVEEFGVDKDKITSETISSTISSEMKRDAWIAVLVAMVLMLIYIWFRFKDPRFGISSVTCLVHDVLIVLAGYALLRVSVGSTFIACMLTIVGYSINATIVIFDRVRENMAGYNSKSDLEAIIDRSVGQTLTRSLFTSLTTFFMVFWLYIFGVSSVKEFALPIMIGIVAGAWSSICIAGSVWFILRKKFEPAKDSYAAEAPKGSGPVVSHNKYSGQGKMSKKERRLQKQKEIEERNKSKTVV
jgi:SecD/SecF fusion protein